MTKPKPEKDEDVPKERPYIPEIEERRARPLLERIAEKMSDDSGDDITVEEVRSLAPSFGCAKFRREPRGRGKSFNIPFDITNKDKRDMTHRMKSGHMHRVEDFMHKAGQEVPDKPTIPDEATRILRAKLIMEEVLETICKGLGIKVTPLYPGEPVWHSSEFAYNCVAPVDMEEVVDGACDINVVTSGMLSACGVADAEPQNRVDEANLAKFAPGGYRSNGSDGNTKGKWIKPNDWTAPDIMGALRDQGFEG